MPFNLDRDDGRIASPAIYVHLESSVRERLMDEKTRSGMSVSKIVRQMIEHCLNDLEKVHPE